jgi:hypothetical protein
MANRNFDTGWTIGKRLIDITGSFGTNGASNPVAANVKGFGFGYAPVGNVMTLQTSIPVRPGITTTPGIVRSATGTYVITLDDSYLDHQVFSCDLQVASASANWAQPGPIANMGVSGQAPNFTVIVINSSGTPQDVAANANSRVHFFIQLRDSTTQFAKP